MAADIKTKRPYKQAQPFKIVCISCGDSCEIKKKSKHMGLCHKCRKSAYRHKIHRCLCIVCGDYFMAERRKAKTCSKECHAIAALGATKEMVCPVCGFSRVVPVRLKTNDNELCPKCTANKWRSDRYHSDPKAREEQRTKNNVKTEKLTDGYVRGKLRHSKAGILNPTDELISAKRAQLTMKRILKEFKKWRKDNESNHTDVSGKQHANEADHEGRIQA